jgi:hypothetical protein
MSKLYVGSGSTVSLSATTVCIILEVRKNMSRAVDTQKEMSKFAWGLSFIITFKI